MCRSRAPPDEVTARRDASGCFLGSTAGHDPRWPRVLQALTARGLCGRVAIESLRVLASPLADGDRELAMTVVAAVYLFRVRFCKGPGRAEDDFAAICSGR
jgi:hypothetical protein